MARNSRARCRDQGPQPLYLGPCQGGCTGGRCMPVVPCVTAQPAGCDSSAPAPNSASCAGSVLLVMSISAAASLALPPQCAHPWGIQP